MTQSTLTLHQLFKKCVDAQKLVKQCQNALKFINKGGKLKGTCRTRLRQELSEAEAKASLYRTRFEERLQEKYNAPLVSLTSIL